MKLQSPFFISSRLVASVRTPDGGVIGLTDKGHTRDGRTQYVWFVDLPNGQEFTGDDLRSGCGGGGIKDGMKSLLSFLGACGESYNHAQRTGREGENADLFPDGMREWCGANTDEFSMLALEIEENPDCIQD